MFAECKVALSLISPENEGPSGEDIVIEKIAKVSDASGRTLTNLPDFCRMARQTSRGSVECAAAHGGIACAIEAMAQEGDAYTPFVSCCCLGAKVLIVPANGGLFLCYCRSKVVDHKHLLHVAQELGVSPDTFGNAWEKLPPFGPLLVDTVLDRLELETNTRIPPRVKASVSNLGRAYGMYEFDSVVYDAFRRIISVEGPRQSGVCQIAFLSKPNGIPVLRVLMNRVGDSGRVPYLPVVGLGIEMPQAGTLKECLDSPLLRTLLDRLLPHGQRRFCLEFPARMSEIWEAHVRLFLNSGVCPLWEQHFKEGVTAILDSGAGTVFDRLLSKIDADDVLGFRVLLNQHANPWVHRDLRTEGETLFTLVFRDLAQCTDSMALNTEDGRASTRRMIESLAEVLSPYPRQVVDDQTKSQEHRIELLKRDLLTWGTEYVDYVRKNLVLSIALRVRRYDSRVIREALALDPDLALKYFLQAADTTDLDPDTEMGRDAWQTVVEFCEEQDRCEMLTLVEDKLFEISTSSRGHKFVLHVIEALLACLTLVTSVHCKTLSGLRRRMIRHLLRCRIRVRRGRVD